MGRMQFLIRVEGANFASTMLDTQDLSTIRGASLALLAIGEAVKDALGSRPGVSQIAKVFSGASQCAFTFEAPAGGEAEIAAHVRATLAARDKPPLRHLSFLVDVVTAPNSAGGTGAAEPSPLEVATARNRSRQFREWTLPLPAFDEDARAIDPFDHVRPARKPVRLPKGKVKQTLPSSRGDPFSDRALLSASVAARRDHGREQRQKFYEERMREHFADLGRGQPWRPGQGLRFADSFADIVADEWGGDEGAPPLALGNKIAVLYADGNGFGGIRADMAKAFGQIDGTKHFSECLDRKRNALLAALLEWFPAGIEDAEWRRFGMIDDADKQMGLRLETLLWGGDELILVVPAWLGFELARGLFAFTRDWLVDDGTRKHPLTHAAGLLMCHHKTPIRQAVRLAHELADGAKAVMGKERRNVLAFAALESSAPPEEGMTAFRRRQVGADAKNADAGVAEALTRHLLLPGDDLDALVETVEQAKTGGADGVLPRSQLYRILREARQTGSLLSHDAGSTAETLLDRYRRGAGGGRPTREDLALPALEGDRPQILDLALIAELWDYVEPFAPSPLRRFPKPLAEAEGRP